MNIAIVFPTDSWNPSYSLSSVVKSQITCFVEAGYNLRILMYINHLVLFYTKNLHYLKLIYFLLV